MQYILGIWYYDWFPVVETTGYVWKYDELEFQQIISSNFFNSTDEIRVIANRRSRSGGKPDNKYHRNLVISTERRDHTRNSANNVANLCRVTSVILRFSGRQTRRKSYYENECPSPDRRGNPFVAVFATKDWNK